MWSREAPLDNRVDGCADVEMRSGAGNRRSRPISAEIIDCKLKAAEERRMVSCFFFTMRLAFLSEGVSVRRSVCPYHVCQNRRISRV